MALPERQLKSAGAVKRGVTERHEWVLTISAFRLNRRASFALLKQLGRCAPGMDPLTLMAERSHPSVVSRTGRANRLRTPHNVHPIAALELAALVYRRRFCTK
jgi:hypothetical protein